MAEATETETEIVAPKRAATQPKIPTAKRFDNLEKMIAKQARENERQSLANTEAIIEQNNMFARLLEKMSAQTHPTGAAAPVEIEPYSLRTPAGLVVEHPEGNQLVTDAEEINAVDLRDDAAALHNFMQEIVMVRLPPARDRTESLHEEFTLNGDSFRLRRGATAPIKRAQLEVIGRCKPITYRDEERETEEMRDDLGNKFRYYGAMTQRYPVEIVKDSSKGHAWWESLLMEPS